MTRSADLQSLVEDALSYTEEHTQLARPIDLKRTLYLRPSGFNYCPFQTFLGLPQKVAINSIIDFGSRYFTSVGTTVHEAFQDSTLETLGRKNPTDVRVLRDWICVFCKHRIVLKARAPKRCPECGHNSFRPDEHEIRRQGLIGHVDEIVTWRQRGTTYLMPWDYKTTSTYKLEKKKLGSDPSYEAQISSYSTLLQEQLSKHGIVVPGWALVYITRDNPWRRKVVTGTNLMPMKQLVRWGKQHQYVMHLDTWQQVLRLLKNRPCQTAEYAAKYHPFCPHRNACTSGNEMTLAYARSVWKQIKPYLPIGSWITDQIRARNEKR